MHKCSERGIENTEDTRERQEKSNRARAEGVRRIRGRGARDEHKKEK